MQSLKQVLTILVILPQLSHVVQKHHALKDVLHEDAYQKLLETKTQNYSKDSKIKEEVLDDENNSDISQNGVKEQVTVFTDPRLGL